MVTFKDNALYNSSEPVKTKFLAQVKCSRHSNYYLINNFLFNFIITLLSITLFSIDSKISQIRLGGTLSLLLTSFSFKVVTSKSLPTIAYLTSLDKYQLINIVYLSICCVWHSVHASLIEDNIKYVSDKIALCCLASLFVSIEIFFIIYHIISHKKITDLIKQNNYLISQLDPIKF